MQISRFFGNSHVIIVMALIGLAHFMVDTMLGIWPVYKTLVHIDLAKAGLIVAVGAFLGEGLQLCFGLMSDKGYRMILIVLGMLFSMAASFLAYFSIDAALMGLYFLTCLGSGCFHPAAASLVGEIAAGRRAFFMTLFAAAGSLGLATSQLSFTHVIEVFEGATAVMAIPSIFVAALILFYFSRQTTTNPSAAPRPAVSFRDFIDFFKNPSLRLLYFAQVANQAVTWGTIFILPDVLKTLEHSDWICYGGGHLCFILGATCMMVPGGILADLYSPRLVMLFSGIVSCFCFYFILFSGGVESLPVLLVLFVLGATLMVISPIAVSMGTHIEPTRRGAVSAFLMGLVWCISEAFGPGSVGLMTHLFDENAPLKALGLLGALFSLQIAATYRLPSQCLQKA